MRAAGRVTIRRATVARVDEDVVERVAVDGEAVEGTEDLRAAVDRRQAGDRVVLTIVRGGNRVEVEVTLSGGR